MKKILLLILVILLSLSVLVGCRDSSGKSDTPDDPSTDTGTPDGDGDTDDGGDKVYLYHSFSSSERAIFNYYIGSQIPFIPTDEYYFESYYGDDDFSEGIHYYTVGNAEADFEAYLALLNDYMLSESHEDDDGNTVYVYKKDSVALEISFRYDGYLKNDVIDVYVYVIPSTDGSDDGSDDGSGDISSERLYTDFTAEEKAIFTQYVGTVIPFVPNDEYYINGIYYEGDFSDGINFYTFGNTLAEYEAYRALFTDYELTDTYEDEYGDTWYVYEKGNVTVELCYYYYEGYNVVDVYVYLSDSEGSDGDSSSDTLYTDFTAEEKAIFTQYIGTVIPFIPNYEYYVDGIYYEEDFSDGINFYTFGNTLAEYEAYRALFTDYELTDTYEDDYGDTWYVYEKGNVTVELCYYYYEGYNVVDVYVYLTTSTDDGGDGDGTPTDADLITNAGVGLPTGTNGVHNVDFSDAANVKDATDQGYYLDGCPTTGSPAVLVIPVEFTDVRAADKGYTTAALVNAFSRGGVTDYYSLYDYYYISSYGQLSLDITVLDFWFCPENTSSYYANATYNYYGDTVAIGEQLILDEALKYLSGIMDLSKFDSDDNGIIDAVVLVNTLDIDQDDDFRWAFRYWNIYTDSEGYYYEYDSVSANDYIWAPYQFLHETSDGDDVGRYDTSAMNTYTFIHEFGHILGADDYYDTSYVTDPMGGFDMMDSMSGDHNAYTKFNLGWITSSRLVVTDTSVTLTLKDFSKNGDTIIIANNWSDELGAYQEYYVLVYYTNTGLNAGDNGYFTREGIVVYHVNSTLYKETVDGETYYDVYNNNTDSSDEYGTVDNLIEYVTTSSGNYTYVEGDSLPAVTDDNGNRLAYTFTVNTLEDGTATITFTRVA